MSTRAMVVWILLAGTLSLVAIAVLTSEATPVSSELDESPLLSFAPHTVAQLKVSGASAGGPQAPPLVLEQLDSGWGLRHNNAPDTWPVLPTRISGALRTLAEMRATAPATESDLGTEAVSVSLQLKDGSAHRIRFGAETRGGRCVAVTDSGRTAWVSAQYRDAFSSPAGPLLWRTTAALPGLNVGVSRLRIQTPGTPDLALQRTGGRWALHTTGADHRPKSYPANATAVDRLVQSLASLRISEFLASTSADLASLGLASPSMRIVCETDRRWVHSPSGTARVSTSTRTLDIGSPADLGAATRYASRHDGRTLLKIESSGLDRLDLRPESYLRPTATSTAPSSVGIVILTGPGADSGSRRTSDGTWVDSATSRPLSASAAAQTDLLLAFFSSEPAAAATIRSMGSLPSTAVRIVVHDLQNAPMHTCYAWRTADGELRVRTSDSVERTYASSSAPSLLRLALGI